MRFKTAFVFAAVLVVLLCSQAALADNIIVSGTGSASGEDHSFRQAVAFGDELTFESEYYGPATDVKITIPLVYSLPSGFSLSSALLEFSISSTLNSYINRSSVPLEGSENDYSPAVFSAVLANVGPTVIVTIGDESFMLMSDVQTGSASADLIALGYGDLLLQGAPISITSTMTLFSYVDVGTVPWWGRNSISNLGIDQYWSGDANASLTFGATVLPEPATLFMVGSGIIGIAGLTKRRARKDRN